MIRQASPNFDNRPPGTAIDMLVLHYTGMPDRRAALDRLADPAAKVSAHYVVDEDGTIFALVDEERRAWHAGRSRWRGAADVNDRSIGVELVNPGHEFGYRDFPVLQMAAVFLAIFAVVRLDAVRPGFHGVGQLAGGHFRQALAEAERGVELALRMLAC